MLLPTMTLDEIYKAVYADESFIMRKLYESAKDFGRRALKCTQYPYKHKYVCKSYKSNIEYTMYFRCFKRRQWDNPLYCVVTSYSHEDGTTALAIGLENKILSVFTSHFWSRFRERYLEDMSRPIQESIDFFFINSNSQGVVDGVMRQNTDRYVPNENVQYYAVANCLGVCFCEKECDNDNVEIYNTYLPLRMLADEQHKKVIPMYVAAYFKDYVTQNPNEKAKIDKLIDDWCSEGDAQNWSMKRFVAESEKLMDEYPLYVI